MSDTNTREASMPTRMDDWDNSQGQANADDQVASAEHDERDGLPLVFAKLAPRPSALGVTYSLI